MDDIQNQRDERGIKIQQTGITDVWLPLLIDNQNVQANVRFTVSLRHDLRGTHMSRLMEILTDWTNKPLDLPAVHSILTEARDKLDTDSANIHINFKYFIECTAPVSKKKSLLDIDCVFSGELNNNSESFTLSVQVPFTSLCPCSKAISDFGAHNQRSFCKVVLKFDNIDKIISINELTELIQSQSSSPVYSILKREDEKFVTEAAYQNAKFVEDILRDVVAAVRKICGINYFSVECINFESIHNHNAFARHEEFIIDK